MSDHDNTRKSVADNYAKAVAAPRPQSCCCGPVQKGVAVKSAGYGPDELSALPDDAVVNSFGCGNPLAFAGVKVGQTVLDLGCGAGIDLLIAARVVGAKGAVIGVDMTPEMIERATNNVQAAGFDNVDVRQGIIEDLPVEDQSVDWVISNCVINLSPDKIAVFREIHRVLRVGGRLSVSDIVVEQLPDWVRANASLYSCCVGGAISEADYTAALNEAGLSDVTVIDRHVYSAIELRGLFESELAGVTQCCETPVSEEQMTRALDDLTGQVWSAKFTAARM
jgi:SAM-dependent methyltransferase